MKQKDVTLKDALKIILLQDQIRGYRTLSIIMASFALLILVNELFVDFWSFTSLLILITFITFFLVSLDLIRQAEKLSKKLEGLLKILLN